jgi:hypothetical protein
MDFRLYARVIWRFRIVCAAGFALAVLLALLAVVRITPHGVAYRQSQLWSSTTRLGVTQQGFPWGRLFAVSPAANGTLTPTDASGKNGIPIADPNRFKDLAILYSELATSDPVRRLILRTGPIRGQITATPVVVQDNQVLPLIDLTAVSTTPAKAIALAKHASNALASYIKKQQAQNAVPSTDRAVLQPILTPRKATVYRARSKTMAIVIFLAVMLVTIGLAFVLENLKPRVRDIDEAVGVPFQGQVRRTA